MSKNHSDIHSRPLYRRPLFYAAGIFGLLLLGFLIFLSSVLVLRWYNPPATSFTLQENWEEMDQDRYDLRDYWVSFDELPEHLIWAVIASEDQLFWEHRGFDIEAIQEAWEERQEGEGIRGASTISQQVAKNIYLSPAHSFFRKGVEAVITVFIELFWPKERIIEVYLNIAEFGPGIFGIGKASEIFFDQPVTALEPEMSAKLAAVLPSPKRMRVSPPSPFAEQRSEWILRQMTHLTGIAWVPEAAPPDDTEEALLEDEDPFTGDIDPMLLEPEFFGTSERLRDDIRPDTLSSERDTLPDMSAQSADSLFNDSLFREIELDTSRIRN